MLSVQPHLAKSMFRFDPISGRLELNDGAPRRRRRVARLRCQRLRCRDAGWRLRSRPHPEPALPHVDPGRHGPASLDLAASAPAPAPAVAAPVAAPAPAPAPAQQAVDLVDDPRCSKSSWEADEVIERARTALTALREAPADLEQLTVVAVPSTRSRAARAWSGSMTLAKVPGPASSSTTAGWPRCSQRPTSPCKPSATKRWTTSRTGVPRLAARSPACPPRRRCRPAPMRYA